MTTHLGGSPHPLPLELHRYADGDAAPADRRRIAAHLAHCPACRREVQEVHALTALLQAEPVPAVPDTTLTRVQARRAAGERGTLLSEAPSEPTGAQQPRRRAWWPGVGAALAASLILAVVFAPPARHGSRAAMQSEGACTDRAPSTGDDPMASLAFRRYAALAYGLPVSALVGCAAEPPNAPVAAAPALAANAVQGTQLVPVKLQYQITTVVDRTVIRSQATRRITVAPSTWKGTPTWRVTATRDLRGAFPSDTLEIDRRTLAPLAAHSRHDGTGFGFSYAVDVPQGTVEMWLRDREGRLVKQWTDQVSVAGRGPGPFLLPIAFRAMPLAAGWTASFEVFESWFLGPYVRTDSQSLHRVTADIQVDGEERVQVPAGTFDCWRVRVQRRWTGMATGSPDPEVVWVSKRDGWIVKTQSTHGTGDDTEDWEMTLVSVQ